MSTTLPDSPMFLDSTGQVMAAKLEAIRQAILNSGGGGGGAGFTADEYDTTVARHGTNYAYMYGDYCKYNDVIYRCIEYYIQKTNSASAFNSSQWEEFSSLAEELTAKPGRIVNDENQSVAFGHIPSITSSGYQSFAEGCGTQSTNNQTHAEGYNSIASGSQAHAEGNSTKATGYYSHAEGNSTEATGGDACHAEGYYSKAMGNNSHAEGYSCEARGNRSHAEGGYTKATGYDSHSEGSSTQANGDYSHAEGNYSVVKQGTYAAHVEGYNNQANADYSHVEGEYSKANGTASHAGGYYSEANGNYSIAQGMYAIANADYSSAIGYNVKTEAMYEVALGRFNSSVTDGNNIQYYNAESEYVSYAVGDKVKLVNDSTHTIYQCTTAITGPAGTFDPSKWNAVGTYDPDNPILFSIGKGAYENNRSNAIEVRRDGTIKLNGNELPKPPTTDGTYTLQCTVSNGVVTYAWV